MKTRPTSEAFLQSTRLRLCDVDIQKDITLARQRQNDTLASSAHRTLRDGDCVP
jgi:hypothetical protein